MKERTGAIIGGALGLLVAATFWIPPETMDAAVRAISPYAGYVFAAIFIFTCASAGAAIATSGERKS